MADDRAASPSMTDIVRRRFETGEFGHAHFAIGAALRDHLLATAPRSDPKPYAIPPNPLGDLLSIPLVAVEEIAGMTWQLRDNSTGEVLHQGVGDA